MQLFKNKLFIMKAEFVFENLNEEEEDMLLQETPPEYNDGEDFSDDDNDLIIQDEFEVALRNELTVPEYSRRTVSFREKGSGELIDAVPMARLKDGAYLMKVGDKFKKFDINNIIEESFKSKKKLNEGSVDDFMMNYGSEIQDALKTLKEIRNLLHNNQRRNLGGAAPQNAEDKYEEAFERLYNIYDESVVEWIESNLGPNSHSSGLDLARMASDNQDSTGTEMKMVLNAIEDLGSAFGIYPGMDDDDDE